MRILIVDDEQSILKTTSLALKTMGHRPDTATNSRQALASIDAERYDAVFLDLRLGRESGLDLLEKILEYDARIPVIVFTAYSSIESAVQAIQKGAFDYVQKPFVPEQIRQVLRKLEKETALESQIDNLTSFVASENPEIDLTSNEAAMKKTFDIAFKAAPTDATVLLLGPSGTGKTVLARQVHARSLRADHTFVTINCPSLSHNLLESELFGHVKGAFTGAVGDTWGKVAAADEGTLFLDEIGELPMEIQPKLLRLIQDKEYERVGETKTRHADIRLVAATNRDLAKEVADGRFREDLYYRLKVISVPMLPLRDRPLDLIPLAENYLKFFAERQGKAGYHLTEDAKKAFLRYNWPGNLRELRNVIERTLILAAGPAITHEDLPEEFHQPESGAPRVGHNVSLDELESEHIKRVLGRASSLEEAARILGIDTATLYRKRKRMGLLG